MDRVQPDLDKRSYNCPRCGVFCPQDHYVLGINSKVPKQPLATSLSSKPKYDDPYGMNPYKGVMMPEGEVLPPGLGGWNLVVSICNECRNYTVWESERVVYPFQNSLPEPSKDMPVDILKVYEEATQVYQHSPRAAAALLRLAIEQLMISHLGVKKGRITEMIGQLVRQGIPTHIQQGLDGIRYYGNKGIHLGEIDLNDNVEKVNFLFLLLNMMVKELITQKKEIEAFYDELPSSFREYVEKRDT